ncbi:uncharacterized protein [Arachis hypogaea]|uniref:uncharacterized protein n=1 Tax=Arachis hypogaea TaxID=3818 RepID=UPI003B214617|nr:uncharacterized protein DS421_5g139460 [Arachis hypogaea]
MDPNKKPEEAAATSEMDKGKRPASSSEEESSEEEPTPRHSDLVTDAAETAARLIVEAEFKEKVAELAAMRMHIARNLAEESQIRLKVLTELRDKTLRGEKVKLNWLPLKDDQDGDDKDKDK